MMSKEQAEGLCRRTLAMLPAGWTPRVWENCGWHFDVRCGPVMICYSEHGRDGLHYWCMIAHSADESGHGGIWQETQDEKTARFKTPREAIMHEMGIVRRHMEAEIRRFEGLERTFQRLPLK